MSFLYTLALVVIVIYWACQVFFSYQKRFFPTRNHFARAIGRHVRTISWLEIIERIQLLALEFMRPSRQALNNCIYVGRHKSSAIVASETSLLLPHTASSNYVSHSLLYTVLVGPLRMSNSSRRSRFCSTCCRIKRTLGWTGLKNVLSIWIPMLESNIWRTFAKRSSRGVFYRMLKSHSKKNEKKSNRKEAPYNRREGWN